MKIICKYLKLLLSASFALNWFISLWSKKAKKQFYFHFNSILWNLPTTLQSSKPNISPNYFISSKPIAHKILDQELHIGLLSCPNQAIKRFANWVSLIGFRQETAKKMTAHFWEKSFLRNKTFSLLL